IGYHRHTRSRSHLHRRASDAGPTAAGLARLAAGEPSVFSRFFIDRPIFAAVLSIIITLSGAVALVHLPLAQFPNVAPQTVIVDCNYPGASALVVAETVAAPIEQQVNGVEGMMYMSSQCSNDGSYMLTVTFQPGADL